MIVEEVRGFPIGMRVLAVDDNPTCLKLLEGLLRKCQYQVTTTNQAIKALSMLRENRNRFDLIISDVYMPDMDGFKLLELIGLEMDLPVIMLSGNGDRDLVMKGVTHGACDYLVKPVRLEELRNIWQHVIRRKVGSKSKHRQEKSDQWNEGGDQNEKFNRTRKDEDEDEENESDDHTARKKARVVWSIELHRKFVDAINHLGIDKAVPKRILDLMNVHGLSRENVASHLQKYRLYLKRMSDDYNMVAAFGGNHYEPSSYMRMNSFDGLGDFRTLSSSGRFPNTTYAPSSMLSRLNSATGVAIHSLTPPPPLQPNHTQATLQPVLSLNQQNMNLVQGILPSFELDQQNYSNKPNSQFTDFTPVEESRIFTGTNLTNFNNNDRPQMFRDPISDLASQAGVRLTSTDTEPFSLLSTNPSFLDENGDQALNFSSNQLPVGEGYGYPAAIQGGFGSNITTTVPSESVLLDDIVQNINQSSQNTFSKQAASALGVYGRLSGPAIHGKANGGGFSSVVQTEQAKLQNGFVSSNGYGSLSDILPGMMEGAEKEEEEEEEEEEEKEEEEEEDDEDEDDDITTLLNGGFGYYGL